MMNDKGVYWQVFDMRTGQTYEHNNAEAARKAARKLTTPLDEVKIYKIVPSGAIVEIQP